MRSVVDVGSGAGKFCVAAALCGRARFHGVEQRPRLVAAARELARVFDVGDRVTFSHAVFGPASPLPRADAYYFYNPFGENLFGPEDRLDDEVEVSEPRYVREVAAVEAMLGRAPVGTYILTYNGFGGGVPTSYATIRVDRKLPNTLRLWRRVPDPCESDGAEVTGGRQREAHPQRARSQDRRE